MRHEKTWVFAYLDGGREHEVEIEGWSKWQAEADAENWAEKYAPGVRLYIKRVY